MKTYCLSNGYRAGFSNTVLTPGQFVVESSRPDMERNMIVDVGLPTACGSLLRSV